MNPKTININARYYLAPCAHVQDRTWDVIDRALEYNHRSAVIFSNGSESECREWVLRNCEEPVEYSEAPWLVNNGEIHAAGGLLLPGYRLVAIIGVKNEANGALIATAPKLLALLEQYHQSFPSKESGKLICEARNWMIKE